MNGWLVLVSGVHHEWSGLKLTVNNGRLTAYDQVPNNNVLAFPLMKALFQREVREYVLNKLGGQVRPTNWAG